MKRLILGLDGMDLDTAIRLNINNVLQLQFDKIAVPINKHMKVPHSPEVWASFLCGEYVEMEFLVSKNQRIFNVLKKLKHIFPFLSFGMGRKVSGGDVGFPNLERETWIDLANVEEINAPYYSYDNDPLRITAELKFKDLATMKIKLVELFENESNRFSKEIPKKVNNESSDVVFAYLHFPDMFNHFWSAGQQLDDLYIKIDKFVGTVKANLLEEVHTIIISDHGYDFENDKHSSFGFISSNKFMNFPKDIIELGKLMYQYAGAKK